MYQQQIPLSEDSAVVGVSGSLNMRGRDPALLRLVYCGPPQACRRTLASLRVLFISVES